MRARRARLWSGVLLAAVPGLACATSGRQQEPDPDADYRTEFHAKRRGFLVSAHAARTELFGDFDGDTQLVGPDTISIPDAESGDGFELGLGWLIEGDAIRLSYGRTHHDGEIVSGDADVDLRSFSLDFQKTLRANQAVQPYFFLGLSFLLAELENASNDGFSLGDARLRDGFGIRGGTGAWWWLGSSLALDLRLHYAYQEFHEAEGVLGDAERIDDPVNASEFGISVGLLGVIGGSR